MSLTRKQVRLLMLSAEDHEYIPDSSQEENDELAFGDKMSTEEIQNEMTEQVEKLRKRTGVAPSKVVAKAIARVKERDFKNNNKGAPSSPIKNKLNKNTVGDNFEEVNTAHDLLKLAQKGGTGITMANKKKIKRK